MQSFKVLESSTNTEVYPINGEYIVYDNLDYILLYTNSNLLVNTNVFLEDYPIERKSINVRNNKLEVTGKSIFKDSFGIVDLKIDNEIFSFNVRSKKMDCKEIEDMISFVYNKNDKIISNFYSKSKSKINKTLNSDSIIPFSSKYIEKLKNIIDDYDSAYQLFYRSPYTVIRKENRIVDYGDTPKEYNIDWLLNNLDEISFDDLYEDYPNSINIFGEYGWIEKIQIQENVISYDTYENRVILGGLKLIQIRINQCLCDLDKILEKEFVINNKNEDYADFRGLKKVQYINIKVQLKELEKRAFRILIRYESLFVNTKPLIRYPQPTPVFRFYSHYKNIFNDIKWLYESKYTLNGIMNLVSLKKVYELYELFNLYTLIDVLNSIYPYLDIDFKDNCISKISCKLDEFESIMSLFYKPQILPYSQCTSLVVIGNLENDKGHYYEPDFVLEIKTKDNINYMILDAKYSKSSTVKRYSLIECSKKYLLDIALEGEKYKKADFLIILNPDSSLDDIKANVEAKYFPQIGSVCVKPSKTDELLTLIKQYLSIFDQNIM